MVWPGLTPMPNAHPPGQHLWGLMPLHRLRFYSATQGFWTGSCTGGKVGRWHSTVCPAHHRLRPMPCYTGSSRMSWLERPGGRSPLTEGWGPESSHTLCSWAGGWLVEVVE